MFVLEAALCEFEEFGEMISSATLDATEFSEFFDFKSRRNLAISFISPNNISVCKIRSCASSIIINRI